MSRMLCMIPGWPIVALGLLTGCHGPSSSQDRGPLPTTDEKILGTWVADARPDEDRLTLTFTGNGHYFFDHDGDRDPDVRGRYETIAGGRIVFHDQDARMRFARSAGLYEIHVSEKSIHFTPIEDGSPIRAATLQQTWYRQ